MAIASLIGRQIRWAVAPSTTGGVWQATQWMGPAPSPLVCLFVQAEPGFVFHHANAYVEDGHIIVDCVRYPRLPDFKGCRSHGHTFVQVSAPALQCNAGLPCDLALALSRLIQTVATPLLPRGWPACSRFDSSRK